MTVSETYRHEQMVKTFLRTKQLPTKYLDYENVVIYTKAKEIMKTDYISAQDYNQLNRFCKRWVQKKGQVSLEHTKRIQSICKYYFIKQQGKLHNSSQKQLRLARKANRLTKTV